MQHFESNMFIFDEREIIGGGALIGAMQQHLFESWGLPGKKDQEKKALLRQAAELNEKYPGGLLRYVVNARRLLQNAKNNVSPYKGYEVVVAKGEHMQVGRKPFMEAEKLGVANFSCCVFVVVAGGLGERLGYNGIKLSLPIDIISWKSYLQHYVEELLESQAMCPSCVGKSVPFVIMTSHDNHDLTLALLKDNNNFGAAPGQVVCLQQHVVPAIVDIQGRFSQKNGLIETKPHGHGDIHFLLHESGMIPRWIAENRKYIIFFQDTNALGMRAILPALGVSILNTMTMNTVAVPRKAGDACGAIATLISKTNPSAAVTVNVEYNQLHALLLDSGWANGDANDDATGFSPFPGNTNQIIVDLVKYSQVLKVSKGIVVSEFVNPKFATKSRDTFRMPTRLECMMQDLPWKLGADAKVGFTLFDRWLCYTPVKNSIGEGAKAYQSGLPPMCAASGESDLFICNRKLLSLAGMDVVEGPAFSFNGISVSPFPIVSMSPSFAPTVGQILKKVCGGKISARSALVIDGTDITIEGLVLDGTLIIRAVPGAKVQIRNLTVQNDGWDLANVSRYDSQQPPHIRMRGYKLVCRQQRILEYSTPGDYVVQST